MARTIMVMMMMVMIRLTTKTMMTIVTIARAMVWERADVVHCWRPPHFTGPALKR